MNPLRIAVIGVGALGRHHARILAGLDSVELIAVAEPDVETGTRVAKDCDCAHVVDYRELLSDVDALTIAVPTFAHVPIASECLGHGIPVMIEKPSLDQAASLVELADRQGVLLQVGHVERFNPAVVKTIGLIDRPRYIRVERLSPFAFRSTDISVVHDLMIHDLDIVLTLVESPLREVSAFGFTLMGGHEDSVQARLLFENGCLADIAASRIHPEPVRHLTAWSASGCVSVDMQTPDLTCYCPSPELFAGPSPLQRAAEPGADIERLKEQVFTEFISVHKPEIPSADALTEELQSFVDCVRNHQPPLVGGAEALRAMAAAGRILDSVLDHQWDGHASGAIGPQARRRRAA